MCPLTYAGGLLGGGTVKKYLTVHIFMVMDMDRFHRVVSRVLEKKYPWIKDIIVTHDYGEDGRHLYGLEVHADRDFVEGEVFMDKHEVDVESDVKSMFDMMGPERWERFDRVRIY